MATDLVSDGARVKVCVQQALGQGVFQARSSIMHLLYGTWLAVSCHIVLSHPLQQDHPLAYCWCPTCPWVNCFPGTCHTQACWGMSPMNQP